MATLTIQKRYGSTFDYISDMAKQSGVYNERLASDPDSGLAYINTLADLQIKRTSNVVTDDVKKDAENKLNIIANTDLSFLDTTDALSRINLAIGAVSEEEFKSYFGNEKGNTFDDAFSSIDDYFASRQQRTFDKIVYDNISDVERFFRGVGYVIGEIATAPLDLAEGLIDGLAYMFTGFGASEAVNEWITKDFTGAGAIKGDLADFRRKSLDWDDQGGIWQGIGQLGNELGKMLVTWGLNKAIAPIEIAGKSVHIGSTLYSWSMAGMSARDTIERYGTAGWNDIGKWFQKTGDWAATVAIEQLTERIFRGGPSIQSGKFRLKTVTTTMGRLARSSFEEGVEEIVSEIFQPIIQNAIQHGNLSKIDENGDWLKNILTAGLIGSLIGFAGEGLNIATFDLSKVGFLKPGQKVTKAQVLGAIEIAQNSEVLFDKKLNSEMTKFGDKYGFNNSDLEQISKNENKEGFTITSTDVDGKTISKKITKEQLNEYNDAIEADKKTQAEYDAFKLQMSKIFTAVGPEAFAEGFNLWAETRDAQIEVLKNWYEYLNAIDTKQFSDKDVQAVEQYSAIKSTENVSFIPQSSANLTTRQAKFINVLRHLFPGKPNVMFVQRYNTQTKTPITNLGDSPSIERYVGNDGQEYIFIDANTFEHDSLSDSLQKVAKLEVAKSFIVKNTDSKIQKAIQKYSTSKNKDEAIYDYYSALNAILTDPTIATHVFYTDKQLVRGLCNTIESKRNSEKSKNLKAVYNNLLATLKSNIVRGFPKKAKALVLKQLTKPLSGKDFGLLVTQQELEKIEYTRQNAAEAYTRAINLALLNENRENAYTRNAKVSDSESEAQFRKTIYHGANVLKSAYEEQATLLEQRAEASNTAAFLQNEVDTLAGKVERGEITEKDAKNILKKLKETQSQIEHYNTELQRVETVIDNAQAFLKETFDKYDSQLKTEHAKLNIKIQNENARVVKELVFLQPKSEQDSDTVMYDKLINENSELDQLPFRWGLVTLDAAEASAREPEVYKLLKPGLRTDINIDTKEREEYVKEDNYTSDFKQKLYAQYPGTTFLDSLSQMLYDKVDVVLLPTVGTIAVPVNYAEFFDIAKFNRFRESENSGKVAKASEFFKNEFFEKYPELKTLFENVNVISQSIKTRNPLTGALEINPNIQAAYILGKSRILMSPTAKNPANSFFHELTHCIFDKTKLHNVLANNRIRAEIADSFTTEQLEDFYESVTQENATINYLVKNPNNLDFRDWLKLKVASLLYMLDLEETVSRGYSSKSENIIFDAATGYAVSSGLLITTTGIQGYGKYSNVKVSFDNNLKKYLESYSEYQKQNLLYDEDIDDEDIDYEAIKQSGEIYNGREDTFEVLRRRIKEIEEEEAKTNPIKKITSQYSKQLTELKLGYLVSSNIKNTDDKAATALILPENASDETKKVITILKKYLFPNEKNIKNDRLLEALNDKTKFSDSFREFVSDMIEGNTLAVSIPMRQKDVRAYANLHFSNLDNLRHLPDTEVQFLLETCFNCSSLQMKTGEDVAYWIETGFPDMAALAINKNASKDVTWDSLQTISQIRKYLESKYKELENAAKDEEIHKKVNEFKATDEKYGKISEKVLILQQIDVYNLKISDPTLKDLKLVTDEEVNKYKKASSEEKQQLNENKAKYIETLITNLTKDMDTLVSKFIANSAGVSAVDSELVADVIDIVNDVKASADRNVFSPLLGRVGKPIKIDKENLTQKVKSLKTTASYNKVDPNKETSDGESLNVYENQGANEAGYERIESGIKERAKELAALKGFKRALVKRFSSKNEVLKQLSKLAGYVDKNMLELEDPNSLKTPIEEDGFHQGPYKPIDKQTIESENNKKSLILAVFGDAVATALEVRRFDRQGFIDYISELFIKSLNATDIVIKSRIIKWITNAVNELNFETEFIKNKREEFKYAVYDDFKQERENEIQRKYEKTLKELSPKDSEQKVYLVSKNSEKVNEQILRLKQEQFKTSLVEKLTEELKVDKTTVEKAFDKVGKNTDNIQNKKAYELAVRNELGAKVDTSGIEKAAVNKQKATHKKTAVVTKTAKDAKTVVENITTLENNGTDPKVIDAAVRLNSGETITKKEGEQITQTVEEVKVQQKAEESVKKAPKNPKKVTDEIKKEVSHIIKTRFFDSDGKVKGGFLTLHTYDGDKQAFEGETIWKIDRDYNGGVMNKLIEDLHNMYDDNPVHFIEVLYELQQQLLATTWLPMDGVIGKKQNEFIGDTISQWLLQEFFAIIVVLRDKFDSYFADQLLDISAINAMISGISLRTQLEISRNQFNINEKDVDTIMTIFSAIDTEKLNKEINEILAKLRKVKEEYEKRSADDIKNRTELKDLKAQREARQKEIDEYNRKIEVITNNLKLMSSNSNNESIKDDLVKAREDLEKAKQDLENIKAKEKRLTSKIDSEQKALESEQTQAKKLAQIIADLESKDPKRKARGIAAVYQYSEQLPTEAKEAVKKSGLKDLTDETVKKYGTALGLTNKYKTLYDRFRRTRYLAMLSSPSTWARNILVNGVMKGFEGLTEIISEWALTQRIATFGIDFDKVILDGATQTIKVVDEDGTEHAYKFPVMNFDWKRVNLDSHVLNWIAKDVFPEEELTKIFGFGGKYGEFKQHNSKSVVEVSHPENWYDKLLNKPGSFIEWVLTHWDAKFTHPMAKRVFGQLIMSNLKQLTEAILTKEATVQGVDRYNDKFKQSDFYKEVISVVSKVKDGSPEAFSRFVELVPKEFIGRFKDAAIGYTKKTFFKNDNALGKWERKLIDSHPFLAIPLTTLTPFLRMSYNVMSTMIAYSPLGFFSWINSNTTYKKMVKKLDALQTIANKDLPQQILKYQQDLSNLYNRLLNQKVSEEGIYSVVKSDLLQYLDAVKMSEKTRLTEEQYNSLKEVFSNLETAMVKRQSLLNNDVAKLTNSITGFEKIDITRDFSKAVIGTCFYAIGALLAAMGVLKIDDDEDYMGVVLNVAGWKIRLSDLSPASSSMMLGVATWKAFVPDKSHKQGELSINTLITIFLNDTPLDFIADAIEYSDNVSEWFANIISGLMVQYVPNIVKQFSKHFSQTKKVKSSESWTRIWQNVADTIPWLRDLVLEDKIDPYTGNPVMRGDNPGAGLAIAELLYFATGIKAVYRVKSPIESEVERLNVQSSGATGRFTYKGKKYDLGKSDPSELTEFKSYRGVYIKDKLTKLINSKSYQRANDETKKELIKEVYSKASEYAKLQWLKNNK